MSKAIIPNVIRNGFAGANLVGTLEDDVKKWREEWFHLHGNNSLDKKIPVDFEVNKSPVMWCSNEVRRMYANARYDEIANFESALKDEFGPIDENIRTYGYRAFEKWEYEGECFYVAATDTASEWIYPHKQEQYVHVNEMGESEIRYENKYQVGKFSPGGKISGAIDYLFYSAAEGLDVILAGVVATALQTIFSEDTALVIASLISEMEAFALMNGCELSIAVSTMAVPFLVAAVVFVIVFIGINCFWKWTNQKYTVKLCVYNWSEEHELLISDCYYDNAKTMCESEKSSNRYEIIIPKMALPGKGKSPPGFPPAARNLDTICHYVTYFFENDSTFLQGCGIAMKMEICEENGSNKGFMYAFDCPRIKDNQQKASSDLSYKNCKQYFDLAPWNKSPTNFTIRTQGIPVKCTLDYLNGHDGFYNPIVHFGVKLE